MNWLVVIRPEVEADVAEAARWYDSKQVGLGVAFVEEISQVWDELAKNPLLYARRHPRKNIRWRYPQHFRTALSMKFWSWSIRLSWPPYYTPPGMTGTGNGGLAKKFAPGASLWQYRVIVITKFINL